uniref:ESF1-like protein n=1 Tax=Timema cristinae TaxID=61476 RepID=A0A7R9CC02_TIMCR|nr:unnamed protein product [Timema cristinae]
MGVGHRDSGSICIDVGHGESEIACVGAGQRDSEMTRAVAGHGSSETTRPGVGYGDSEMTRPGVRYGDSEMARTAHHIGNNMDDILKDDRFSHIFHDPRFKRIPKLERKVKIDKRFQSMFKDKKFQVKYTVDKRGRPIDHTTNEDLRKYYDISSNDESDIEEDKEQKKEKLEHGWGELDHDAEPTDEITNRLAVCNMDWDNIRVSDLMVLFNSFLPANGIIKSVTNEEGNEYHMEKLRQYQLNKLKYYYAVVVCDSPATANKIYTECDGLEYESSSSKLDLRFIPDETTFDQEPHEVCESLPDMSKYQPRFFNTTALQQSKVDLTWDDDNPERVEITQKAMSGEVEDLDLRTLLADYSSEEDPENEQAGSDSEVKEMKDRERKNGEDSISKYRALLLDFEEEEQRKKSGEIEMEVSWGLGLKEKAKELMKGDEEDAISDDDIPSSVDMNDPYFKEEFQNGFPQKTKKITKKNKETESDDEETKQNKVDVKDDRFEALFSSHHYNIDPADPHYRKTKAMEALKLEKLKRRQQEDSNHFKTKR